MSSSPSPSSSHFNPIRPFSHSPNDRNGPNMSTYHRRQVSRSPNGPSTSSPIGPTTSSPIGPITSSPIGPTTASQNMGQMFYSPISRPFSASPIHRQLPKSPLGILWNVL